MEKELLFDDEIEYIYNEIKDYIEIVKNKKRSMVHIYVYDPCMDIKNVKLYDRVIPNNIIKISLSNENGTKYFKNKKYVMKGLKNKFFSEGIFFYIYENVIYKTSPRVQYVGDIILLRFDKKYEKYKSCNIM